VVLPDFQKGRVQPDIRVVTLELARAEALHLRIQLLTQAADLALRNAVQPEGFDQVIHPACAHPLHVGLAHGRHQRPLSSLARLQQAWEEAAVAYARHAQLERAHPRIPVAVAVAIAFTLSFGAALVALGAQVLGHLQFHQRLGHHPHTFAQRVQVWFSVSLA
jgi:hypothetical protein